MVHGFLSNLIKKSCTDSSCTGAPQIQANLDAKFVLSNTKDIVLLVVPSQFSDLPPPQRKVLGHCVTIRASLFVLSDSFISKTQTIERDNIVVKFQTSKSRNLLKYQVKFYTDTNCNATSQMFCWDGFHHLSLELNKSTIELLYHDSCRILNKTLNV